jgi:glycosyltransferase involved in cell wall biosynthesis
MRHDVAIYSPFAAGLYERRQGNAGGAERQMTFLARALADRGHRVAHIVYDVSDPALPSGSLTLVPRGSHLHRRGTVGAVVEGLRICRALWAADAAVTVVRTGTAAVGLTALFCRLRGRRLVFSSASNADFTQETASSRRARRGLYRLGVRLADAVVLQSQEQLGLARAAFPGLRRVERIPSFAEPADAGPRMPECFLWLGRAITYKQPERFVELARAVPEARFRMVAVPDSSAPAGLFPGLAEAARELPNLEVLGPQPYAATMELIRRAVAVVNTSVFEGMPNVFLESWMRGVPVLSLQVDPDGIIARHGLGVAAGGSWERFTAGARELWQGRDHGDELAGHVRAYVEAVHSPRAVGERWSALIAEIGAARNGHREPA